MNEKRWQDWVMLVLGVWLFFSPFILQFTSYTAMAAWNSYILGVAVTAFAVIALAVPRMWEEWTNLVLGAWLIIAPFLLGYSSQSGAAWDHVILGVVIAAEAVWAMGSRGTHHRHGHA